MKRLTISAITIILLLFASQRASAQFSLALGVTAGLDGAGLELATPIGSQLQLRAGYSTLSPIYKYQRHFDLASLGVKGLADLDAEVLANLGGANLLLDWHPGGGAFFFTAGVYASSPNIVTVRNREPFLDEEDWGSLGIVAGNKMIVTDDKGILSFHLSVPPVRPYAGFGFGNAVTWDKVIGFMMELGACYTGGFSLNAYGEDTYTFEQGTLTITSADVNNEDKGIIDKVSAFPVLPLLKFGLYVKLF